MCRRPIVLSKYEYRFDKAEFTAVRLAYSNLGAALLHLQNRLQRRQVSYKQIRVVLRTKGAEELYDVEELLNENVDEPMHYAF